MFRLLKLVYFVNLNFNKSEIVSELCLRYLDVDMIERLDNFKLMLFGLCFLIKLYILRIVK